MRTPNPQRWETLAKRYEAGESVADLAAQFGVTERTLRCAYLPRLRKEGLVTRRDRSGPRPKPWPSDKDRALAADYEAGHERSDLMERYHLAPRTLNERLSMLRKAGLVSRRDRPEPNVQRMLAMAAAYNDGATLSDIAKRFGYASDNAVNVRLYMLRRLGLLTREARHGARPDPNILARHDQIVTMWSAGTSRRDIADALGVSLGQVGFSVHLERSRRALEASLERGLEA